MLSALAHADAPEAAEVAKAALTAARCLDDDRSVLCLDLVLAHVGEAAHAALEELMASRNYEYQSDFAKRYFGQGQAEALLKVLTARGLEVPDDARVVPLVRGTSSLVGSLLYEEDPVGPVDAD